MKLVIEIEAPELDIIGAITSIPQRWLDKPDSPIQLLACALKAAYEKHRLTERQPS